MANETNSITPDSPAVLSDAWEIIEYKYPPTGYQFSNGPLMDPDNATAVSMTADERLSFTPPAGYLIWDTTIQQLFVGDGQTAGGVAIEGGCGSGPTLTLVYDNTTPNLQMDTITAITDDDATIQYLPDGSATWEEYLEPVNVYANGIWIFKATNTAGDTTKKTIVYDNFASGQPTPPPPEDEDEED